MGRGDGGEDEGRRQEVFFSPTRSLCTGMQGAGVTRQSRQVPLELEPSPGRVFPRFFFAGKSSKSTGPRRNHPNNPTNQLINSQIAPSDRHADDDPTAARCRASTN
jgi:hypothetical protein